MINQELTKPRKIDVSRPVAALERVLRCCSSRERCDEVLALLRCWQDDELLDDASRRKARLLIHAFAPAFGSQVGSARNAKSEPVEY